MPGDDSVATPPAPRPTAAAQTVPPPGRAGGRGPDITARAFMVAWLDKARSSAEWTASLAPLSTPALRDLMAGVDPAGVPASRMTGPLDTSGVGDTVALVRAPVDTGNVTLRMVVGADGLWLVDGVDWERS
jgi:hypothetical protein